MLLKPATVKHSTDVLNIDQVLELLGLPDYDSLSESNWETIETRALSDYAYQHDYQFNFESWVMTKECEACDGTGFTEDDRRCPICHGDGVIEIDREDVVHADPKWDEIYSEAEAPLYKGWLRAVEYVLNKFLGYHHLQSREVQYRDSYLSGDKKRYFYVPAYRIEPQTDQSWKSAAQALVDTISGYGWGYPHTALEFLQENSYASYKQMVLDNLASITQYADVYDEKSTRHLYDRELEINLYNW